MTKMRSSMILVMALSLAGCQSLGIGEKKGTYDPPKNIDKMSPAELCAYYNFYLTNPDLTAEVRAFATNKMKAMNCQ